MLLAAVVTLTSVWYFYPNALLYLFVAWVAMTPLLWVIWFVSSYKLASDEDQSAA
jgi:hypothetical protein